MMVEMMPAWPAALALGAALGFFGGLFGIGGGIVAIPVLVIGFGMEQAAAQGTALVMMVPNLLMAWWRYARRHRPGARALASVALAGSLATWMTAAWAQSLDQSVLRLVFAAFLGLLAIRMIRPGRAAASSLAADHRLLPLVGLAGGGSMGLLGVGGGLVATPLLSGCFGLDQRAAQGLALAIVTPSAVVALGAYAGNGRVAWDVGAALAVGGLATVAAGVALAHAWPERTLKRAFGWMLAATALVLLFQPGPS